MHESDTAADTRIGSVLQAERAFRVMGSDAHVLVWQREDPLVAPEDLLDLAVTDLERLEARWSRFRSGSDVSRANRSPGVPVTVADETVELATFTARAQRLTNGFFDPTLLRELEAAGYDRPFDEMAGYGGEGSAPGATSDRRLPIAHLGVDREGRTITCPTGRGVDFGGVGKGRAADLVASRLLVEGAVGACVNLGGDLRVLGEVSDRDGIIVGIEDPLGAGDDIAFIALRNAAVATTARTRRCWQTDHGPAHHVIDPRTGQPADSGLAAVTVIAPTAAWAEVAAKAAFVGGPVEGRALLSRLGLPALMIDDDAHLIRIHDFERYER